MYRTTTLVLATSMALASGAAAAPVIPIGPKDVAGVVERAVRPDDGAFILVQNRTRGGGAQRAGGGAQRAGGGANRGSFNSNDFHRTASNTQTRSASANRNVNVNANRNVNVSGGGGCCYGNYNSGPNWGGVAAGVAVGAVVGAAATSAASSPTYVAPPPTYPPGYVSPPPY